MEGKEPQKGMRSDTTKRRTFMKNSRRGLKLTPPEQWEIAGGANIKEEITAQEEEDVEWSE